MAGVLFSNISVILKRKNSFLYKGITISFLKSRTCIIEQRTIKNSAYVKPSSTLASIHALKDAMCATGRCQLWELQ